MDAPLRTGPPVVTLRNASSRPYDSAIAAARTCYSPRVIGTAADGARITDQMRKATPELEQSLKMGPPPPPKTPSIPCGVVFHCPAAPFVSTV